MKVTVVGPGAMGCLFAGRFAHAGIPTTLVDYKSDRSARLQNTGIVIESEAGNITAKPTVATHIPSGQDLVVLCTKAYSTRELKLPNDVPVLTLQNGLGNVEVLCGMVGSGRVLAGVTFEAATLQAEGTVRHAAGGETRFGSWTSCPAESALKAFTKAGFDASVTEAPGQMIWEKVAVNAGINPLTALLDVENGQLLEVREIRELMRNLVVEAAKVASTEGYRFDYSLVERAEQVCYQTRNNISSMLQDVRAKKRTEIDALSGEILQRAELASLPCPRTKVVYQLVKGLERR